MVSYAAANPRGVLLWRIRIVLVFFSIALVASGLTAIPLEWELNVLAAALGLPRGADPQNYSGMEHWIAKVREGVCETGARYPFIAYGFDWLAFAHIILGILFLGPLRDPVRNRWVLTFGLIACVLVVPWSLVFGLARGIPIYWRLIDASFGALGLIPLWLARRWTVELESIFGT